MKRLDINDNTSISMPIRNMIAIIGAVAVGVWAYFGVTERLNQHSTSLTLMKKEMEVITAQTVGLNYLNPKINMKVVLVGHLSFSHYQMFLKQKQIIY